MAAASPQGTSQQSFTCSVCLDLLKDPVTTSCGHTFCRSCINRCWDQEVCKGSYSCPQCREKFWTRPVLSKNTLIAEMVEGLSKDGLQAAYSFARPISVECDICIGTKLKAVKCCLDCQLSYCETHLKAHNDLNQARKHSVIDATGQLQERIYSYQKNILEHTQRTFRQRIQERERELQELRKAGCTLRSSIQSAVEHSESILREMIHFMERRCSEVIELIKAQENTEMSRAEAVWRRLEQEIAELKRRDAELEQLLHTKDHIYFLKNAQSFRDKASPLSKDLPSMTFNQIFSEALKESVIALRVQLGEKLDQIFKEEAAKIFAAVTNFQIMRSLTYTDPGLPVTDMAEVQAVFPEPVTREEFLQYSCHFTLDPNTAHGNLHLSEGNRRVDCRTEVQSYPYHLEGFRLFSFRLPEMLGPQRAHVLCREGVSGRCYWEVEWTGAVNIAVSYKNNSRVVSLIALPNSESWSLNISYSHCSFENGYNNTKLPLVPSSRIGVYVDHRAGTLAFYSITDTMTLLHRVQTTFTQPLYPEFMLQIGSLLKLV